MAKKMLHLHSHELVECWKGSRMSLGESDNLLCDEHVETVNE